MRQETPVFKDPKLEDRASELREQLRSNPQDVEKRIELGRIFLKEELVREAADEFEKAIDIDSHHIEAYLLLALAIQRRPDPDPASAITVLEKAAEIAPDNGTVRLNLAHAYHKVKDDERAIDEFGKAIKLTMDQAVLVSAHLGLMSIYKKRSEVEKADTEYEAARKIYPGVGELIKQAEINRITPSPRYAGEELKGDDGMHPSHEERIGRLRDIIKQLTREAK